MRRNLWHLNELRLQSGAKSIGHRLVVFMLSQVGAFSHSNPGQGGFHRAPLVLPPVNDDDEPNARSIQAAETGYCSSSVFLTEFKKNLNVWVWVPGYAGQIGNHVEEVLLRNITETWELREGDDGCTVFTSPSCRTKHKTSRGFDISCYCCIRADDWSILAIKRQQMATLGSC